MDGSAEGPNLYVFPFFEWGSAACGLLGRWVTLRIQWSDHPIKWLGQGWVDSASKFIWGMENYPSIWGFSRCHYSQYKDPLPIQPGFHRMSPAFFSMLNWGSLKSDSKRFVESLIGENGAEKVAKVVVFRFLWTLSMQRPSIPGKICRQKMKKSNLKRPTSQCLFIILEAVRLNCWGRRLEQKMLKMTCICWKPIIAQWQLLLESYVKTNFQYDQVVISFHF